ncbi:uncharacterized protein LOC115413184 [Sphaeramia orbicularis]|uniref:uncharacterized protein LOC115413184 n=1 Tax=Sphaeramia orbicularis TaxID=375764 RepID=UPI00117C7854|nr:uncharacterized protein LOC115413184 [Sphaeramia orbicularis]
MVYEVAVDSGEESVLLPYKTIAHLTKNFRQISVEWRNLENDQLIVHKYGSGQPDEQDQIYRNRTEMKKHWLRTGDFSLTLKHPTDLETSSYSCTVYNKDKVLKKKRVVLEVKVQQVEVDSGLKSVLLPWKTTFHIEDVSQVTVEWTAYGDRKVHVYEDGSDRTNEQDDKYRNRTEMKEDPLRTGDLSLILKHPTDLDTRTYTCTVYNRDKQILRRKQVRLEVKVQQVKVDSGLKSVLLPWKTTLHIEDVSQVTVEWTAYGARKVHVYEDGSDRTNEQDDEYRNRTEMKEDPLRTGDLSLILKHPTDLDTHTYTCTVYNRDKQILRRKQVRLKVKGQYCRHRLRGGGRGGGKVGPAAPSAQPLTCLRTPQWSGDESIPAPLRLEWNCCVVLSLDLDHSEHSLLSSFCPSFPSRLTEHCAQ